MQYRFVFFWGWILLFLVASGFAHADPIFARYVGVLRHESPNRDQLAKLDFIASRGDNNQLELMAILTLHFGDYRSGEYVSYHFDTVKYTLLNGTLVFDHPGQDMTIKVESFDGRSIKGSVRSRLGAGDRMTLSLTRDEDAKPLLPLIQPLQGQYEATCDGVRKRLQIQTFRSTLNVAETANPFAAYEVRAQLGEYGSGLCMASKMPCTVAIFDEGSYNFFHSQVVLAGDHRTLTCQATADGLDCGACRFKRIPGELPEKPVLRPPQTPAGFVKAGATRWGEPGEGPALKGVATAIDGEYSGYLHHEYLDQYQSANLSLVTSQGVGADAGTLRISPVASLKFGEGDSHEFITYKFNERSYPLVSVEKEKMLLFQRTETDTDAVLQITSLSDGKLKGVWYSLLFGRVGTFELSKNDLPALPTDAKRMGPVGGWYENATWDIELIARPAESPRNTSNPFFPLHFTGFIYDKDGIRPKERIGGGTYDFYSGKISVSWKSDPRAFVGFRNVPNRMTLGLSSRVIGTPLQPIHPQLYRYSKERGDFK